MRLVVALAIGWLATGAWGAVPSPTHLGRYPRTSLYGREYIRLVDWARASQLKVVWLQPFKELQATNRSLQLRFTADSRRAEFNGVVVWLSHPIAVQNGTAYVSPLDLQKVVHPLLYPPKNKPGLKVRRVCIDAGHGGKDPGNIQGSVQEKKLTLSVAQDLKRLLENAGLKVVLTRKADTYVDLDERPLIAGRNTADLFISLHFNNASGPEARGAEVYCLTPAYASSTNAQGEGANTGAFPGNRLDDKNMLLAFQIQKALVRAAPLEDRGVRRARWAVLRGASMPAVLVEGGFMSHPEESAQIYDAKHRHRLAQVMVDGILAYKRLVER